MLLKLHFNQSAVLTICALMLLCNLAASDAGSSESKSEYVLHIFGNANLDAIASFEESETGDGRTVIKLLTGESLEVHVPAEALNEVIAEAARERSYVEATVRDPDEMGSGLDGGRTILDTTNDFLSWASCGGCGCTTLALAATAVGLLTRAVLLLLVR